MHDSSGRRPGHRRMGAWTSLALLALAAIAPGGVAAGGGNSAAAHRCQMGGWTALQDASGTPFADQSACVSYSAGGGQAFSPSVSVVTTTGSGVQFGGHYLLIDIAGSGFHPNSTITFSTVLDGGPTFTTTAFHPATNSQGAFSVTGSVLVCELVGRGAGDSISGQLTATDASGVHASAPLSGTCSS